MSILMSRMSRQCSALAISANGDPIRFAIKDVAVLADRIGTDTGPLAGISAGFDHTASAFGSWLLTVPVDTPFIPLDLASRLAVAAEREQRPVAHARSAGRDHPLVALWSVGLRDRLSLALTEGGVRRVTSFVAEVGAAAADWPVLPYDPFFNINTPDDLVQARLLATTIDSLERA